MLAFCAYAILSSAQILIDQDLFVSGNLDPTQPYNQFRIPSLVQTSRGTLIAVCEGRQGVPDQSQNVLAMRRRLPGSANWTPITVIEEDQPASLNNPCMLVTADRVWLMYEKYPAGYNQSTVVPGYNPTNSVHVFVTSSYNDGASWAPPLDITSIVKDSTCATIASGPGIGIQLTRGLHAGRLLFPFTESTNGENDDYSVFSDDNGQTWRRGPLAPKAAHLQPNEVQFVELWDGSVLLNARNQAGGHYRISSVSTDGGETWPTIQPEPTLTDPVCEGSIVRQGFFPDRMLFSNADSSKTRTHGAVKYSDDGGRTWTLLNQITGAASSFEYSCLCPITLDAYAIVYESFDEEANGNKGYRLHFVEIQDPIDFGP